MCTKCFKKGRHVKSPQEHAPLFARLQENYFLLLKINHVSIKLTAGPSIIVVQSIQLEHNSLLVIYKKTNSFLT